MLEAVGLVALSYLQNYIIYVVLAIGMTLLLRHNELIGNVNVEKLWYALFVLFALSGIDNFESYCAGLPTYTYARTVAAYLAYILKPLVLVAVIDLVTNGKKRLRYSLLGLSAVNAIIYIPMLLQNTSFPLAHSIVWYDANNVIHYGSIICNSSVVIEILLGLLFLFTTIRRFRKRRREGVLITFIFLVCLFAGIVELAATGSGFAEGLYINVVMACVFIYFTFLHINITKVDPVTNLYNRASFYADSIQNKDEITAVISLDMNGLKAINDNQGHKEGDIALAAIADAFEQGIKKYPRTTAYRTGGDEFMMLFYGEKEELLEMIKVVRAFVDDTDYTCSIGYAYKDDNQTVDEMSKIADDLMYADKSKFYQLTGKDRRK